MDIRNRQSLAHACNVLNALAQGQVEVNLHPDLDSQKWEVLTLNEVQDLHYVLHTLMYAPTRLRVPGADALALQLTPAEHFQVLVKATVRAYQAQPMQTLVAESWLHEISQFAEGL